MTKSNKSNKSRKLNTSQKSYSKKSKRNTKKSRSLRNRRQRSIRKKPLRLIRNKRGGGLGFAPWVGAQAITATNNDGNTLASLEQPYIRSNGCLLMSCPGNKW